MHHRKKPCRECPWRRDTPPGQFDEDRYEALRSTVGEQGAEASWDAPMFACHLTAEGREQPCAGWLAVVGIEHLGVRIHINQGSLPPEVLQPGDDWPPLFETYDELVDAQARRE